MRVVDALIDSLSQSGNEQDAGKTPGEKSGSEAGASPGEDPGRLQRPVDVPGAPDMNQDAIGQPESTRELLIQVWGQLPAHLQEQIQSPTQEQFLPQYERLIIEYYRRLAEIDEE